MQTYNVLKDGQEVSLSLADICTLSEYTILFVYPKDNTPWCSLENKTFTQLKSEFAKKNIQLVGLSKDSIASHQKFVQNYSLEHMLISDPELILHKELWAYGEKKNYGKTILGVIRSTFLLNSSGEILQSWKNVKATWHAERILKEVQWL